MSRVLCPRTEIVEERVVSWAKPVKIYSDVKHAPIPLEETPDAFGTPLRVGDRVVFYQGNGAHLRTGEIQRIVQRHGYKDRDEVRLFIAEDGTYDHVANVGRDITMRLA